jgi:hypothetical protein
MTESKMWGTPRVSYQDLGETRLVVKHSKPVNYDLAAGRTMHIESIYIENAQGERFRYPVRHLNGARAMAQHIGHGGNPYDEIGQHVVSLSEELSKLRMFKGYVSRTPVVSESMSAVNNKVIERIEQVKKQIHQLQQSKHYEEFAESFAPAESKDIPEEIMLDWVDRLTVRSFKEELKDVFPYIYKLVDESEIPTRELDPDDLLAEEDKDDVAPWYKDKAEQDADKSKSSFKKKHNPNRTGSDAAKALAQKGIPKKEKELDEDQFERFLNRIVNEDEADALDGNPESIQALKTLISQGELIGDPNRVNSLTANGLDVNRYPELQQLFDLTSPNDNAWPSVKAWMDKENSELSTEIFAGSEYSGEEGDAETPPEAPAPEAPAPEAPAGGAPEATAPPFELPEGRERAKTSVLNAIRKGAKPDTKVGSKTLHDIMMELGMDPHDPAAKDVAPPVKPRGDSYKDMKAFANGWWNKEEQNFTIGNRGVKTKIEKQFPGADQQDLERIFANIDRADPPSNVADQEQGRMKQLAGVNANGHESSAPQYGTINESLSIIRKLSGLT